MSTLSLIRRHDPFAEFDPFSEFNTVMRSAFGPGERPSRTTGFTPRAEVSRDGEDAVIRLELPGMDAENDVTVEVKDGRLTVRGERKDERTEEDAGRSLTEIRYGEFRRSFTLPKHVTADAIEASYDAGVLSLRVSGAYTDAEAKRIPVRATAPAVEN